MTVLTWKGRLDFVPPKLFSLQFPAFLIELTLQAKAHRAKSTLHSHCPASEKTIIINHCDKRVCQKRHQSLFSIVRVTWTVKIKQKLTSQLASSFPVPSPPPSPPFSKKAILVTVCDKSSSSYGILVVYELYVIGSSAVNGLLPNLLSTTQEQVYSK